MRRKVRVQLHRRQGKRLRSVTVIVLQVSLGGFIECLRAAGNKVMEFRAKVLRGRDMTDRDAILAMGHPDVCSAIADVLCPDQPRGWYRPWHSEANVRKMLQAAAQTSDWNRLIGQLNLSGTARPGRGSLYGDALTVARILQVNPQEVLDEWSMERFLDICDELLASTRAAQEAEMFEDPSMDPEAKPTPLQPGLGGKVTIN